MKVFEEATTDWKAPQHNQHWCLAHIEAQCDIAMGLDARRISQNGGSSFVQGVCSAGSRLSLTAWPAVQVHY